MLTSLALRNRIVKSQGAAPPWIELQRDLDMALETFRSELRQAWFRRATRMRSLDVITRSTLTEVREGWRDPDWEAREQYVLRKQLTISETDLFSQGVPQSRTSLAQRTPPSIQHPGAVHRPTTSPAPGERAQVLRRRFRWSGGKGIEAENGRWDRPVGLEADQGGQGGRGEYVDGV